MEEHQNNTSLTEAEKQAEALLQLHRTENVQVKGPHKNHKITLALYAFILTILIIVISVFLANQSDVAMNTQNPSESIETPTGSDVDRTPSGPPAGLAPTQ